MNCNKYGYILSDEARDCIEKIISYKIEHKDDNFANAREIRNLFEGIITDQATRVAEIEEPTDEQLNTIEKADMEEFLNGSVEDDSDGPASVGNIEE